MIVKLKENNGLNRRSIEGKVFFINKVTEVPDNFDLRKYSFYLEKVKETTKIEEPIVEKEISSMTKQEMIEAILVKYPNEYTKTDLNKLKKEVLEMTLQGELE